MLSSNQDIDVKLAIFLAGRLQDLASRDEAVHARLTGAWSHSAYVWRLEWSLINDNLH